MDNFKGAEIDEDELGLKTKFDASQYSFFVMDGSDEEELGGALEEGLDAPPEEESLGGFEEDDPGLLSALESKLELNSHRVEDLKTHDGGSEISKATLLEDNAEAVLPVWEMDRVVAAPEPLSGIHINLQHAAATPVTAAAPAAAFINFPEPSSDRVELSSQGQFLQSMTPSSSQPTWQQTLNGPVPPPVHAPPGFPLPHAPGPPRYMRGMTAEELEAQMGFGKPPEPVASTLSGISTALTAIELEARMLSQQQPSAPAHAGSNSLPMLSQQMLLPPSGPLPNVSSAAAFHHPIQHAAGGAQQQHNLTTVLFPPSASHGPPTSNLAPSMAPGFPFQAPPNQAGMQPPPASAFPPGQSGFQGQQPPHGHVTYMPPNAPMPPAQSYPPMPGNSPVLPPGFGPGPHPPHMLPPPPHQGTPPPHLPPNFHAPPVPAFPPGMPIPPHLMSQPHLAHQPGDPNLPQHLLPPHAHLPPSQPMGPSTPLGPNAPVGPAAASHPSMNPGMPAGGPPFAGPGHPANGHWQQPAGTPPTKFPPGMFPPGPGTPAGPFPPIPGTPGGQFQPAPGTPVSQFPPGPGTPAGPFPPVPGTPAGQFPPASQFPPPPGTPAGPFPPVPSTPAGQFAHTPGTPASQFPPQFQARPGNLSQDHTGAHTLEHTRQQLGRYAPRLTESRPGSASGHHHNEDGGSGGGSGPPWFRRRLGAHRMSADEIDHILRIQHHATHQGEPYVEDYYFQAFVHKHTGGRTYYPFAPELLREFSVNGDHDEAQVKFLNLEGLGKIVLSNIKTPKVLMDVSDITWSADAQHSNEGSQVKPLEKEPLLAARMMIEDCMHLLLDVDDVDRALINRVNRADPAELRQRRTLLLDAIVSSFRLPSLPWSPKALSSLDGIFLRITSLAKGRVLIARTLRVLSPPVAPPQQGPTNGKRPPATKSPNANPIVWAVLRNAYLIFGTSLVGAESTAAVALADANSKLSAGLVQVIRRVDDAEQLCAHIHAFVAGTKAAIEAGGGSDNPGVHLLPLSPNLPPGAAVTNAPSDWLGSILSALLNNASRTGLLDEDNDTKFKVEGLEDSAEISWKDTYGGLVELLVAHVDTLGKVYESAAQGGSATEAAHFIRIMLPNELVRPLRLVLAVRGQEAGLQHLLSKVSEL